jgi:hypothetical protein
VAKRTCSLPDCDNPHKAKGYCEPHYWTWKRYGDPRVIRRRRLIGPPEYRFWEQVDKGDGTGCWLWTGQTSRDGYGRFWLSSNPTRRVRAHRYAYTLLVGLIPEGLEPDHVKERGCTSKLCVKAIGDGYGPAHLELVTHRENLLRGASPSAKAAAQTHCKRGHPFDDANTRITKAGARACRACHREWERARRQRVKAEAMALHVNQVGRWTP